MKPPINEKIRAYRQAKKISQKNFATMLGVAQNTLSELETGRYFPNPEHISKLEKLGVKLQENTLQQLSKNLITSLCGIIPGFRCNHPKQLKDQDLPKKDAEWIRYRSDHFGIRIKPEEGLWVNYQLKLRGLTHQALGDQLGIRRDTVTKVIRGIRRSARVEEALFRTLGFHSFEAMIAASRGKRGAA